MPPRRTIKARMHHGANSLDLTIPTEIRRAHGIEAGDVFEVSAVTDDGHFAITYRRVFPKFVARTGAAGDADGHSGNTRV